MLKKIKITLVLIFAFFSLKAQKLLQNQSDNIQLPFIYKIDGIDKEWGSKFAAQNKSVGIKYSIANSDDILYLILKAEETQIINKIVSLGVRFDIKSNNKALSVSYPVYDKEKRPLFLPVKQRKSGINEQEKSINDSLKNIFNAKIAENLLKIGVEGLPENKDSLISIYNKEGIRASGKFDKLLNYTLEFAIPIKLIGKEKKVEYTIQLNGVPGKIIIIQSSNGERITYQRHGENWMVGFATPENYSYANPSSLSGTYTLAK
jgi:hypothetical protein